MWQMTLNARPTLTGGVRSRKQTEQSVKRMMPNARPIPIGGARNKRSRKCKRNCANCAAQSKNAEMRKHELNRVAVLQDGEEEEPNQRLRRIPHPRRARRPLTRNVRVEERNRKMTPGPTIIRKCSSCGGHIAQRTIGSGNTFGARFWTDGWRDAPMLPDEPWLVTCPHCSTLVWIDEQKKIGEIETWGASGESADRFKDARPVSAPILAEYTTFLTAGIRSKKKERYVRLRTWWVGNDARREGGHATPMTEAEIANLRVFSAILDEKEDNDRLMKAEALRELGMFQKAEALLAMRFEEGMMQAVGIIRDLNQKRSTAVEKMEFK